MHPKTVNQDLPFRLIRRNVKTKKGEIRISYYYQYTENGKRKKIPLGSDLAEAKRKWAELECAEVPLHATAFGTIAKRYFKEVLPTKAPRTQKDYHDYLKYLLMVFEQVDIETIQPRHIRQYLDVRPAKVRANREIALFSTIFNHAKEWGYTEKPNPCEGVRKNKERPRAKYVTDEEYATVFQVADPVLQQAMALAYLTGQRPADALKIKLTDIHTRTTAKGKIKSVLFIEQNKTGERLRIKFSTTLKKLIENIQPNRPQGSSISENLLVNEKGQPLTADALRSRFEKAREKAGVHFQFRDLRAKAATDVDDLRHASNLLGHLIERTTSIYRRRISGLLVKTTR